MIAPHWILITQFLFNDGHNVAREETLYKKEYCIEQAHNRWGEFYKNEMDTVSTYTTICRNEKNNYDFVKIICDKNVGCNI